MNWTDQAACLDADPRLFHMADHEAPRDRDHRVAQAKVVCGTCPVVAECLEWALDTRDRHAVLGGLTPDERRPMRRRRRGPITHGTAAGHRAHHRRGETPCNACLLAARDDQRRRRAREQATA